MFNWTERDSLLNSGDEGFACNSRRFNFSPILIILFFLATSHKISQSIYFISGARLKRKLYSRVFIPGGEPFLNILELEECIPLIQVRNVKNRGLGFDPTNLLLVTFCRTTSKVKTKVVQSFYRDLVYFRTSEISATVMISWLRCSVNRFDVAVFPCSLCYKISKLTYLKLKILVKLTCNS